MLRVGVVPEDPDLPREMTADAIAAFCARLYPRWDAAAVAARLDRLRVPRRLPTGRLSKGQRAQLALTLAMAHGPELLVLDDPTLGLDAVARRELWEDLVSDLADRGTTVLLTTHDLAGAEGIADRVGILKQGRLVLDEALEALKARFRRIYFRPGAVGADIARAAGLDQLGALQVTDSPLGSEAVVDRFTPEAFAHFAAGGAALDPEARPMSLEEVFVAVAGDGPGGAP
jgi:ABC-2 type transport system ATP-binding protein